MPTISIISWNIGPWRPWKILNFVRAAHDGGFLESDVVIFGFQEVQVFQTDFIKRNLIWCLNKYNLIPKDSCSTCSYGYTILTCFFVKKNLASPPKISTGPQHCEGVDKTMNGEKIHLSSKGFTQSEIRFTDGQGVRIYNAHFPFEEQNDTRIFLGYVNKKKEIISSSDFRHLESPTFLFGDLNSRCLLTSQCYEKKLTETCKGNLAINGETKYCELMNKLNNRGNFEAIEDRDPERPNMRIKDLVGQVQVNGDSCSLEKDPSFSPASFSTPLTEQDLDSIITKLYSQDSLARNTAGQWYEADVKFLPTYKRDKKNISQFKIKKESHGRLPGYADRIIFDNKEQITAQKYTSLYVNGNDHLPIAGKYTIGEQPPAPPTAKPPAPPTRMTGGKTSPVFVAVDVNESTPGGSKSIKKRKYKLNKKQKSKSKRMVNKTLNKTKNVRNNNSRKIIRF